MTSRSRLFLCLCIPCIPLPGLAPVRPLLGGAPQDAKGAAGPRASTESYRVAAAHILVLHKGSFDPGKVTRDRDAARALAEEIRQRVLGRGVDFGKVSREVSEDHVRRESGGYMGIFRRGMFTDDFRGLEDALFRLALGEISPVVETTLGFHIVTRVLLREWKGSHILIQYRGARKAPASLQRTPEEAAGRARQILAVARRPGADFADLARRFSEAPDKVQGGSVGLFSRGEVLPELQSAIASLEVGAVGGPVKSPLGYHLVRRDPIVRMHLAEIFIRPAKDNLPASRKAWRKIHELRKEAAGSPDAFARLARQHSNHPRARFGGDLGYVPIDCLPDELARVAARLEVNHISAPTRSARGFHVLKRLPDPEPRPGEQGRTPSEKTTPPKNATPPKKPSGGDNVQVRPDAKE